MEESETDSLVTLSCVGNVLCIQGAIKISNPDKCKAEKGILWKN